MAHVEHGEGNVASNSFGRALLDANNHNANQMQVYVTVLKACNLPSYKDSIGMHRQFYVAVTDGITTSETKFIRNSEEQIVTWNKKLGPFDIHPSRDIRLSLYSRRRTKKNELVGTLIVEPVVQTQVSHIIDCQLNRPPSIILTIYIDRAVPTTITALDEADNALISINLREDWKGTLEGIQLVMSIVSPLSELSPYSKVACKALSLLLELFSAQLQRDRNVQALSKTMRDTFNLTEAEDLLKAIKPNSNQALILKLMMKHIKICSDVIQKYAKDKGFTRRFLNNITDGVSEEIKELCETLRQLRQDLLDNTIINTQIGVYLVQKSVKVLSTTISDIEYDAKIDDLPYKSGWSLTSTKSGCIEGTRTRFLEYILEWVRSTSSKRVLVLFGQAGTGKSTIAFEIASLFCIEHHLSPYYSFSRDEKSKREDHHLFTTIIRDLADRHDAFKSSLGTLIKNNTPLRKSDDFNRLFVSLLLDPLKSVALDSTPELIVIDALDESSDPSRLSMFLAKNLNRLPENFRVLITSRPEHGVKTRFVNDQLASPFEILEMDDPQLATATESDIRIYLQKNIAPDFFTKYGEDLLKRSEGLFQWVAVACGYINEPPPGFTTTTCLRGLLGDTPDDRKYSQELLDPLRRLYLDVLAGYFKSTIAQSLFCSVIGQLLSAMEPISANTLMDLRQHIPGDRDRESVHAVVRYLGSLMSNTAYNARNKPIIPLHVSFRDFLTDTQEHQHPFSVNLSTSHKEMAYACIDVMLERLEFNICKLESSYLRNKEVPDLQARIDKCIPSSLSYACRLWQEHLGRVSFEVAFVERLAIFFKTKYLYWLEVLSIIGQNHVSGAASILSSLTEWLQSGLFHEQSSIFHNKTSYEQMQELFLLVNDASKFLRYFGHVIATSAPHIYISALPFSPTSSYIFQNYSSIFPSTLSLQRGQLASWLPLEMTIATAGSITSVAFSPDGQWIASGSSDSTVCIWNSTTGELEGKPFTGHTGWVRAVAFSPNGKLIVSSADDCTVRVWNISTGTMEGSPLTGHSGWVLTLDISRDGERIVSGSLDGTVRVWNLSSRTMEGNPLTATGSGTNPVFVVAFSPDGKYIASGSSDNKLLLWNTSTQVIEANVITGHTQAINSVAFSPDGLRIVTGSYDTTIRVWNVAKKSAEGLCFIGHTDWVLSVSFSSNKKWIVSGSADKTIRVWNARTGAPVGPPLAGHSSEVRSVAFSMDGRRVVSGSKDNRICVWDVPASRIDSESVLAEKISDPIASGALSSDGQKIVTGLASGTVCMWDVPTRKKEETRFFGDKAYTQAVAFSPDRQRIASGSRDGTICLWNVSTGLMHGKPLSGHTAGIRSIIFSSDGCFIVSGSNDSTVRLWDTSLGIMVGEPFVGHTSPVLFVAFLSNRKHILSVSEDYTIYTWDISTRSQILTSYTSNIGSVCSAALSPDGKWVAFGMDDGTINLWNVSEKMTGSRVFSGHTDWVYSVSFSPSGQMLVSGSRDCTVRVWNLASEIAKGKLYLGHTAMVLRVSFSSDEKWIFSASEDRTTRLWSVPDSTDTKTSSDAVFTDESVIGRDGWIRGSQGELIMWVPPSHREVLHRPSSIYILGAQDTRLDISRFVHGSNWIKCCQL